ncbi:MAG: DUF4326 domain-containing protein [Thermosynechococcaceae cyanobacterium]
MPTANMQQSPRPNGRRCDRQSNLGNPFMTRDGYTVSQVCEAYRLYFNLVVLDKLEPQAAAKKVQANTGIKGNGYSRFPMRVNFMHSLSCIKPGDTLLCWCDGECHTFTIEDYVREINDLPPISRTIQAKPEVTQKVLCFDSSNLLSD